MLVRLLYASRAAPAVDQEELHAIRLYKNCELVERFFGELTNEQIEQVRKAVFVEDGISVGLEYED